MDILLIEPDSMLANQYAEFLTSAGYKVRLHTDAQGAILAADKHTPDAVILEPLLRSHSGIEFLYEFRTYPEWGRVPVIILSRAQRSSLGLSEKIQKDMRVTYLYKPDTSLEKLTDTLKKVAG